MKNSKYHILIFGDHGEELRSHSLNGIQLRVIILGVLLLFAAAAALGVYLVTGAGELHYYRQNRTYYDSLSRIDSEITQIKEKIDRINQYSRYIRVTAEITGEEQIPALTEFLGDTLKVKDLKHSGKSESFEYVPSLKPVNGVLSRTFTEGSHAAVDFSAATGSLVRAAASGVVKRKYYDEYLGNVIEISHGNGYLTRYAHCENILVELNSRVTKGDAVATVGSTGKNSSGPHLHFAVEQDGQPVDPKVLVFE
ncbi:MAG: M23 family metallopeptidase [Fibrobacterota bacterium]